MNVIETELPGVLIIEPKVLRDSRGFFFECFHAERYKAHGMKLDFVQDNFSHSTKNVLRGLHYQLEHAQGKLVWVTRGRVFDVAVDMRRGSPHFGEWTSVFLDAKEPRQFYIPPGFAHGFCTLSDEVDFYYKCTDFFHPAADKGIRWDDPDLGIPWPVTQPTVSDKDKLNLFIKDIPLEQLPIYE